MRVDLGGKQLIYRNKVTTNPFMDCGMELTELNDLLRLKVKDLYMR